MITNKIASIYECEKLGLNARRGERREESVECGVWSVEWSGVERKQNKARCDYQYLALFNSGFNFKTAKNA